jgi:hypothetical protein
MQNLDHPKFVVALLLVSSIMLSTSAKAGSYQREIAVSIIESDSVKTIAISVNSNRTDRKAHKFHLDEDYQEKISVRPVVDIDTKHITLDTDGNLMLRKGFSWNGANGTIDTKTILRGSMVHDALYQLMREGELDNSRWRETADNELKRICREDGMGKLRAGFMYFVVRRYGENSTKVKSKNPENKILLASIQG